MATDVDEISCNWMTNAPAVKTYHEFWLRSSKYEYSAKLVEGGMTITTNTVLVTGVAASESGNKCYC